MSQLPPKNACLALSGGMDSSTLLLHLLAKNCKVMAISFDYGQKHKAELEQAKALVHYLLKNAYQVEHHVIVVNGLLPLLHSSLVESGAEVPEGHYAEENMLATVVPNRNKIFSSIIQAAALSLANKNLCEVVIALGVHAGDHVIYPDCRPEFIHADYQAFLQGNWDAEKVSYYLPYLELTKFEILQDGLHCCESMGLNFDEIYKRTLTSYKPNPQGHSDYKSSSSIERIEAFIKLGKVDPIVYADETGIVTWDKVKHHVEQVLAEQPLIKT